MRSFLISILLCITSIPVLAIEQLQSWDSCRSPIEGVSPVQPQLPSCVVSSIESMGDLAATQLVFIRNPFDVSPDASIPSAQSMSYQQLKHSRVLRSQSLLLIAEDPLFHLQPNLCKELKQLGFKALSVLAFGANALPLSEKKGSITASNHKGLSAADFISRYPNVDFKLLAASSQVSVILEQLQLQHRKVDNSESFEQQVFNEIATAGQSPVLIVGAEAGDSVYSWVKNTEINQLFYLKGGVDALIDERHRVHQANISRLGINKRFRCAQS